MPIWIAAVLSDIKRKHRGASVSAVERLTSNLGLAVMRKRFSPDIDRIIEIHSKIYSSTDLILLYKCYEKCDYELKETFGTCYRKCSVREYAAGAISEFLVEPLNITTSTAVLLVLIAGISTSKTWVPSRWTNLAEKELNHFTLYLEDEEKRLKEVLLGKD
jgi:hypothetical protein